MVRKATSIKVDDELWKKFKIKAIQKGKGVSTYFEDLIKKELNIAKDLNS